MTETNTNSDIVFEKYYPQHPLPNEIKKLPTKETICQFCGISYLIHSEIKRLEEEIILLNKKIKYLEELKVSETKFEKQYNEKCSEMEQLLMNYSTLNETFIQSKKDRDRYQNELNDKNDTLTRLEASLKILKIDRDKFIDTQNTFIRQIFDLQKRVRNIKEEFASSKQEVIVLLNNYQGERSVHISQIKTTIEQIENCRLLEFQQYQNEIKKISLELFNVQEECKEKERQMSEYTSRGQDIVEKNKSFIQEISQLESQLYNITSTVSQKDEIIRMLRLDIEELSVSKNSYSIEVKNEITELKSKNQRLSASLEETEKINKKLQSSFEDQQQELQRLVKLLQGNDAQLNEYKDVLKQNESQMQKFQQDIQSMAQDSEINSSINKAEISKLMNELKAKEKNSQIIKHELANSYKRKLSEKNQEITQLQLNDELQKKNIREITVEKEKLHNDFIEIENDNRCVLQKMNELQNHFDLEKKSHLQKSEDETKSLDALEKEIEEKENLIDKMENDLIKQSNEITILKQMVQKECEERYELTEALNQARQQLLLIGDYHIPKTPNTLPPIKSNASSASDKRSSTLSMKEKRNSLEKINGSSKNSVISTKRKLESLFNT